MSLGWSFFWQGLVTTLIYCGLAILVLISLAECFHWIRKGKND